MILRSLHHQRGATLIEVLVAMGLAAIMLPALATAVVTSREGRAQDLQRLHATALQRETIEALQSVRETGWAAIATNGTYYPTINGGNWTLASGTETVNDLTRSITISDVQRTTAAGPIVASGTVDPSTKKVTVSVAWNTPIPTTMSTDLYIQRYHNNTAWLQTTQTNFDTGAKTNVVSTNSSGGEIQLASVPGSINWSSPTIAGSLDIAGIENPNDVVVSGNYAYVADATILRIIDISNPAAPTLTGSYTAPGTINNIAVSGNYAYLATGGNTQELTVVAISTPTSPTVAATRDLGDTADASSIYVLGNYAYVGKVNSTTSGINEFYVVSISTPTSPTISGSLNIAGNVNNIYVVGNYAYIATSVDTAELTIINIATPATPASTGVYNTAGTADALDLFVTGTTAYVGTASNSSSPEFFIVNCATPASPSLVGSYNTSNAINGVAVNGTNAFLATSVTNQQFMVLNLSTPASPALSGSFNMSSNSNDIFYSGNYAYVASQHDTRELTIMQGTETGGGYQTSGTFESSSFDATSSAAFNYLTFTVSKPAGSDVLLQVAFNTDNTTWNYFGPDGTGNTFFTASAVIPLGKINGRYARYKATLTGNGSTTPSLQDVSLNYSP